MSLIQVPERTPPSPPNPEQLGARIEQQIQDRIEAAIAQREVAGDLPSTVVVRTPSPPFDDMPPRVAEFGQFFLITLFAIVVGFPIARAIARWIDRRGQAPARPSTEVTSQLTQLTQSVDAIAIEVERISEGQRFTTKLLADLQSKRGSMLPSETVGSRAAE